MRYNILKAFRTVFGTKSVLDKCGIYHFKNTEALLQAFTLEHDTSIRVRLNALSLSDSASGHTVQDCFLPSFA